jgi:predicted HicB family RNase H-like nuclease
MPLTGPMKTATFLIRLSPEERENLNRMAKEQRISLAHAMRQGARLYLEEQRQERDEGRRFVAP